MVREDENGKSYGIYQYAEDYVEIVASAEDKSIAGP